MLIILVGRDRKIPGVCGQQLSQQAPGSVRTLSQKMKWRVIGKNIQNDFLASARTCTVCVYVHECTSTHIPHKTRWDGTRGRTATVVLWCAHMNKHMYNRKKTESLGTQSPHKKNLIG